MIVIASKDTGSAFEPVTGNIIPVNSSINISRDITYMSQKSYDQKTGRKMDFTGVEIAWVDVKSNKYPLFHIYHLNHEWVSRDDYAGQIFGQEIRRF